MISVSLIDQIIIYVFFLLLLIVGFIPKKEKEVEGYLLSNRNVGLLLFIMTNVATWYGGILGVGEFTYRYGLLSWFTQGLPYYLFAFLFALFFAKKIRSSNLYTIPDKLEAVYGRKVGIASSILVFILVSPAPYLLMTGSLFSILFNINLVWGLILGIILSSIYLLRSGYKSDLYTDVFQFVIMFIGFGIALIVTIKSYGGYEFLQNNLPAAHLKFTGNVSLTYIIVWFMIALWTFADPGFHQRCYAAKNGNVAKWGIIISIFLWALFDFLTTTTGLYSKAILPNLSNPVLSFPYFAEKTLGVGLKGIFYAALFATIISTLNSFLFLSATTFGKDFISKIFKKEEAKTAYYTRIGLIVSSVIAILLAYFVQSVVNIWYLIGSICIPGVILLIFGAYNEKFKISKEYALLEIVFSVIASITWYFVRPFFTSNILLEIEPMIIGLIVAGIIHFLGILKRKERLV